MHDMTIPGYDEWRLQGPDEDRFALGHEEGEPCNRVHEPDEDAPRGYRSKPCQGVMIRTVDFDDRHTVCDTCGEIGD